MIFNLKLKINNNLKQINNILLALQQRRLKLELR